jgi:serine/threonine-protein kinase
VLKLGRVELLVARAGVSRPAARDEEDDGGLGHTAVKATPGYLLDDGAGASDPTVGRVALQLDDGAGTSEATLERPSLATALDDGAIIDGRYRIVARLAAGGMGEVFRVEHVELGKPLALKVMRGELSADADFANRFKIEAVAASRIGHPNIINISDFGRTASGQFYFVMEYLDGLTLSSLVNREGPQDARRAVALVLQCARALAAAHALHIVHRDLKPDNVMVLQRTGNPDHVKVLDFGIARVKVADESLGHTAAGLVVGTPQYMSPEQTKGLVVDARSDIYSLGLIFHELLTGAPTFTGETAAIVMVKQVTEPPPPLPDTVPREVADLVLHMVEKHPDDRPQSMSEVVQRLNELRSALTSMVGVEVSRPERASVPVAKKGGRQLATDERPAVAPRARVVEAPPVEPVETSQAPPAPSRSVVPFVIGVLALVGLGAGAFVLSRSEPGPASSVVEPAPPKPVEVPPQAEAPPAPRAAAEVKVRVLTTPPGATVTCDGVTVGNSPVTLRGAGGAKVQLKLDHAGYHPVERALRLSEDIAEVTFRLEPLAEAPPKATPQRRAPRPSKADEALQPNPFLKSEAP